MPANWVHLLHFLELFLVYSGKMADKMHKFPTILVLFNFFSSPGRHPCKTNAVMDDVKQLTVGERLGFGLAHVRGLRIKILPNFSLAAAVICMTARAVIGKMSAGLRQNL